MYLYTIYYVCNAICGLLKVPTNIYVVCMLSKFQLLKLEYSIEIMMITNFNTNAKFEIPNK